VFEAILKPGFSESASREVLVHVDDESGVDAAAALVAFCYTHTLPPELLADVPEGVPEHEDGKARSLDDDDDHPMTAGCSRRVQRLLAVLMLADRYQMKIAAAACASELSKRLALEDAVAIVVYFGELQMSDARSDALRACVARLIQEYGAALDPGSDCPLRESRWSAFLRLPLEAARALGQRQSARRERKRCAECGRSVVESCVAVQSQRNF
jgi:hypothetical protein